MVKRNPNAPAGFFDAEAAGLKWLAAAHTVGGARVVEVLDSGPGMISLERLTEVSSTTKQAEEFGRALAVTHAAGASSFGVGPDDGPGVAFIGRQMLPLGSFSSWGQFYAELRLLPYARTAHQIGHLSAPAFRHVELICERLGTGEFDDGGLSARIHGDLWTGNVLWTQGGGTLIDPAAHGGHGQTDLAMLALFGAPHLSTIESAYAETAELPADWRDRTGVHQLHPLLVHAVSHGPSYGIAAADIARRYV